MVERLLAIFVLIILSPVFLFLSFLIILSGKPIFFKQMRVGKHQKPFVIYKFRTMKKDAEKRKKQYLHLNEADGPVFKIKDDPRYMNSGKILSRFGLDELPQLINIAKGDMAFVGPRPLPVDEAKKVPQKYRKRFSVLPGITSLWVVNGAHALSFDQWMELDIWYIKHKSVLLDIGTSLRTIFIIVKVILHYLYEQGRILAFTK